MHASFVSVYVYITSVVAFSYLPLMNFDNIILIFKAWDVETYYSTIH